MGSAASRSTPNQFASVISGVHHPSALPNFAPPLRSFLWPFLSRQLSSVFFLQSIYQPLPACASACASASTMSAAMRLGSSALRTSLRAPAFSAGTTSFQAIRCYSAKTQVRRRHWELPSSSKPARLSWRSVRSRATHAWPVLLTHRPPARPSRSASLSSCPRRSRRSRPSESQSPQTRLFRPHSAHN